MYEVYTRYLVYMWVTGFHLTVVWMFCPSFAKLINSH